MLRYTTRAALYTRIYDNVNSGEVFTLLPRLNVKDLGLTMTVVNEYQSNRWYEWAPDEALDNSNTAKFPLVLVLHGGGDHEVYDAESNGWVALAGKERFIVVSPQTNTNKQSNLDLIDAMIAKYRIDESRIYVTGFSQGSSGLSNTLNSKDAVERFTAMAPFSFGYNAYPYNGEGGAEIPAIYHTMSNDINTADGRFLVNQNNFTPLTNLFTMNRIPIPAGFPDSTNTFWRFNSLSGETSTVTPQGIRINTINFNNDKGINMIRLC
jgi:predicted esterase